MEPSENETDRQDAIVVSSEGEESLETVPTQVTSRTAASGVWGKGQLAKSSAEIVDLCPSPPRSPLSRRLAGLAGSPPVRSPRVRGPGALSPMLAAAGERVEAALAVTRAERRRAEEARRAEQARRFALLKKLRPSWADWALKRVLYVFPEESPKPRARRLPGLHTLGSRCSQGTQAEDMGEEAEEENEEEVPSRNKKKMKESKDLKPRRKPEPEKKKR